MIYNRLTKKYVMWFHLDSSGFKMGMVGVATCDTVAGDYKFNDGFMPDGQRSLDMGLFQDSDGAAYLVHKRAHSAHRMGKRRREGRGGEQEGGAGSRQEQGRRRGRGREEGGQQCPTAPFVVNDTCHPLRSHGKCVVRGSYSGHQLLFPPADWCPIFALPDHAGPVGRQQVRRLEPADPGLPTPHRHFLKGPEV